MHTLRAQLLYQFAAHPPSHEPPSDMVPRVCMGRGGGGGGSTAKTPIPRPCLARFRLSARRRKRLAEVEGKLKVALQERAAAVADKATLDRHLKQQQGQKMIMEKTLEKKDQIENKKRESIMVVSARVREGGRRAPSWGGPALQCACLCVCEGGRRAVLALLEHGAWRGTFSCRGGRRVGGESERDLLLMQIGTFSTKHIIEVHAHAVTPPPRAHSLLLPVLTHPPGPAPSHCRRRPEPEQVQGAAQQL